MITARYFNKYLQQTRDDWNYITPQQLHQELEKDEENYFLLDVRRPEDYTRGHIPGTVNIFWLDLFKDKNIRRLPTDKTIIIICYLGHTASQVLTLLKLLGYQVMVLKFGMGSTPVEGVPIAGWNQFGYPIEHHHPKGETCRKGTCRYCRRQRQILDR